MEWNGLDAEYPFEQPRILCYDIIEMSELLGCSISRILDWETNGDIPARTRTGRNHNIFWTEDNAKETFIKGFILMHKGL